jgi:predicted TIM-barrel fold metal-dependent hydrolase
MDVSGLHPRPWQCYNALRLAVEYRVADKLLFGSDFPFFTMEETVASLRSVQRMAATARLPAISDDVLETIITRDGLAVIGL